MDDTTYRGSGSFHALPDDVLKEIFSLVDHKTLASLAKVCKKFNRIAKEYEVRKVLYINSSIEQPVTSGLRRVLASYPYLTHLIITDDRCEKKFFVTLSELVSACVEEFNNLLEFKVHFKKTTSGFIDPYDIVGLISYAPELHVLDVVVTIDNNLTQKMIHYSADNKLMINGSLINQDILLEDEDEQMFDEYPPLLSIILIHVNFLCDEDINLLLNSSMNSLVSLKMSTHYCLEELVRFVYGCTGLQNLIIGRFTSNISLETFSLMSCIKRLRILGLTGVSHYQPMALTDIFSEKNMSHLTYLSIHECESFDDNVLFTIAKWNRGLARVLIADNPNITDRGILKLFKFCTQLCEMQLIKLPKIQGYFLSFMSSEAPNLKTLHILHCPSVPDRILARYLSQ